MDYVVSKLEMLFRTVIYFPRLLPMSKPVDAMLQRIRQQRHSILTSIMFNSNECMTMTIRFKKLH